MERENGNSIVRVSLSISNIDHSDDDAGDGSWNYCFSATTKYRDLAMLIGFGLQLWQYGTPVAYGLRLVPEKYMKIYMLNPMTPIITSFRYIFFGTGYFHAGYYGMGWGSTMILFVLGIVLFNKVERTFMDTI